MVRHLGVNLEKVGEVNPETELRDLADHWRGWLESVCKCSKMVEGLDPRCLRVSLGFITALQSPACRRN